MKTRPSMPANSVMTWLKPFLSRAKICQGGCYCWRFSTSVYPGWAIWHLSAMQFLLSGLMITRPWVRAPLVPTCLCPWARHLVSIASLTWAYQGGIGRGKYYNLSANKVCTWPVAPLGEAKWLWRFPWYRNNRQQRFVSSGKRRYTNADIIIYYYLLLLLLSCSFPCSSLSSV